MVELSGVIAAIEIGNTSLITILHKLSQKKELEKKRVQAHTHTHTIYIFFTLLAIQEILKAVVSIRKQLFKNLPRILLQNAHLYQNLEQNIQNDQQEKTGNQLRQKCICTKTNIIIYQKIKERQIKVPKNLPQTKCH